MTSVNVKIIHRLKSFLKRVNSNETLVHQFSSSDADFTRIRKLPFDKLVLMIARLNKKTLGIELANYFSEINEPSPCSVSAFCQRRSKLLPSFFHSWNMVLHLSYYLYCKNSVKRWRKYRLIASDGSGVSLVKTKSLEGYFGGQSNQTGSFVQGKTFFCYDVLNGMIIHSGLYPYRYGEHNMAYDAVELYEDDMLIIYDRNFCSYKMVALHLLREKEIKFIIRAQETQLHVKKFIASGATSSETWLEPGPAAIKGMKKSGFIITKNNLIKIRLVRVELTDKVEVLMTNLWEDEGHKTSDFKDLYNMRWGIETNIGFQKNIMQLESFSGLTAISVLQDFYASVFIANLYAVLKKEAQQIISRTTAHRKYPMQINNNKAFGKMKSYIIPLFIGGRIRQLIEQLNEYFIRDPLPIRAGRSFKRERKNRQSNSKFRTFTNFKPAY